MELEIKHISPYLPYGLMVAHSATEIYSSSSTWEMEGIVRGNIYLKEITYPTDIFSVKPILRPTSDLKKEGRPTEWVTEINRKFKYDIYLSSAYAHVPVNWYPQCVFEYLIENHFDVFGLIDAGLAINLNDLKDETAS